MVYKILFENDYNDNFGDFKKCESLWQERDEEFVKMMFKSSYEVGVATGDVRPWLLWGSKEFESSLPKGKLVRLPYFFVREHRDAPMCPTCGEYILEELPALSRRDNTTEICSQCSLVEAFQDMSCSR